jgi:hypothetical protein
MNTQNNEIRQVVVPAKDTLGAVFGWLALIAGIGAIVLWGIVFVPLALLFAGLALWRKNWVWGSVGGVLGLIGIALSPTLWALFAGVTLLATVSDPKKEQVTPRSLQQVERPREIEQVKAPSPAPKAVQVTTEVVQKEIVPTIKMEVFGKDDQLEFEVAKVTIKQDSWCKPTTDIALIVKRSGFIANSLGILETASQLASYECDQVRRFDISVLERPVEGDLKALAKNSYFFAQMKRQPDGRWVSR